MANQLTPRYASIRNHLKRIDKLRGRKTLNQAERLFVLRVFFGLKKENIDNSHAEGGSELVNVRGCTSRLCGRAKLTVQSIVTSWNKAFSTKSQGDESLIYNAIQTQHRGNRRNKPTRTPNNSQILHGV